MTGRLRRLRVWWPKERLSGETPSSFALFGWFVSFSPTVLDIVVAVAVDDHSLSHSAPSLEDILHQTNEKMPAGLRDKSVLCMLGHAAGFCADGVSTVSKLGNTTQSNSLGYASFLMESDLIANDNGCCKVAESVKPCREAAMKKGNWVHMRLSSTSCLSGSDLVVPDVDHIHWRGEVIYGCDVHVIVFDKPTYGLHHFISHSYSSDEERACLKNPKWLNDLYSSSPSVDLGTVILAINSSAFTSSRLCPKRHMKPNVFCARVFAFALHALAVSLATLSTLQYIVLQHLHNIVSSVSSPWVQMMSPMFESTSTIIKLRSHEIFYWPIFLQHFDFRSHSCVEYAEKAAWKRHSLWSRVAVDVILGNWVGFVLLLYAESICLWCVNLGDDINDFLRVGCVWLMGVPAGFKLNTELAVVLGTFSLNVIQVWSILWGFISYCSLHILVGVAVVGMLFGVTSLAAIIIDIFVAVTFHISALHWLVAHLYSTQIEALAGFWRLFRGQKWNPLRLRLDSYDYTVKQHVVGSLLFAPLLLLLPTTSVFYIFFTITSNYATLVRIVVRVVISIVRTTPFFDIFIFLLRPTRFPAGLWFEVSSFKDNAINAQEDYHLNGHVLHQGTQGKMNKCRDKSCTVISFLYGNFQTIGQILLPHYRSVLSGISWCDVASAARGALLGKRMCIFASSLLLPIALVRSAWRVLGVPFLIRNHGCFLDQGFLSIQRYPGWISLMLIIGIYAISQLFLCWNDCNSRSLFTYLGLLISVPLHLQWRLWFVITNKFA